VKERAGAICLKDKLQLSKLRAVPKSTSDDSCQNIKPPLAQKITHHKIQME
jgi:hypothetical protein